jgi:phage major head subunit gpT-like protein
LRFQAAFGAAMPFYMKIATVVPSTTKSNTYAWMDKIPKMRKWVGDRVIQNLAARAYTLENEKFELTLGISADDIEDDQIGVYQPSVDMMGQSAATYPDDLMAVLMKNGQVNVAHDGQFFFDTDHPINLDDASAGTQSNFLTGLALNPANFASARAQMMSWVGADSKNLGAKPTILAVPPLLENMARVIAEAENISVAGGSTQTNVYKGAVEVVVIGDLAGGVADTEWYLLDTSKPIRPFVFQNRKSPVFTMHTDPKDPSVLQRDEFIYEAKARGAAGYSLWFLALKARA